MDVRLPDGTKVRASPLAERIEHDPERSFGLYLDPAWEPTWDSELVDWPDFGVPSEPAKAAAQISTAFARARAGELVEVGCIGGLGRTGTVLACMAVLSGLTAAAAIDWIRANYNPRAVETPEQTDWVHWFAGCAARLK